MKQLFGYYFKVSIQACNDSVGFAKEHVLAYVITEGAILVPTLLIANKAADKSQAVTIVAVGLVLLVVATFAIAFVNAPVRLTNRSVMT